MRELIIYTDGSVYPNDGSGIGGWAFVALNYDGEGRDYEYGQWVNKTTNNRMELTAAISALSVGERGEFLTIVTDSQYVQRCFARRQWPASKPNSDLGRALMESKRGRSIEVKLIPGHSGDKWNDRAHDLANKYRLEGVEYEKRRAEEAKKPRDRIEEVLEYTLPSQYSWTAYPPSGPPQATPYYHLDRVQTPAPTPSSTPPPPPEWYTTMYQTPAPTTSLWGRMQRQRMPF